MYFHTGFEFAQCQKDKLDENITSLNTTRSTVCLNPATKLTYYLIKAIDI